MPSTTQLQVSLGDRSYPIHITTSEESPASVAGGEQTPFEVALKESLADCTHAIVISDAAVIKTVAAEVERRLAAQDIRVTSLEVASGETSKSVDQISTLWNTMLESGTDRRSVVFAVGGGVIGDLAGFAAASFTRGLRFVQVPTTLLAMVDSSVGGKTGINLPGGKNMVGAFWQPELVWIDTQSLNTLPDREFFSGLAEVIKYGVIEDAEFFKWLQANTTALVARDPEALREAIARSCQSKARVVSEDERETTGRRAILNYGHTFAHAIETNSGYGTLLHGEAVSIGMHMAAHLAVNLGLCDASLLEQQTEVLNQAKLPVNWSAADPVKMIPVMARDKKVAHGKLRFVLPIRIGHVQLVGDVAKNEVERAIHACRGPGTDSTPLSLSVSDS